jgi:hypothetical protein
MWGFQPSFNFLSLLLFVRAIIKAPITVSLMESSCRLRFSNDESGLCKSVEKAIHSDVAPSTMLLMLVRAILKT